MFSFLKSILCSEELERIKILEKACDELSKQIVEKMISEEKESYYNNKYPKKDITYWGRRFNSKKISMDIRNYFTPYDSEVKKIIKSLNLKGDDDVKAYESFMWVLKNFSYEADMIGDYWNFSYESLFTLKGDCFAGYEKIYTINGLKQIKDIKIGETVLSYDFNKREYVYKKVINLWNKGKLKINRVHFRNGQYLDVSENHPFWIRQTQKESIYQKTKLSDIDLTRWWKRKVPVVKKLPYEIKDIKWLNEDLCLVLGHFLAEGWVSYGKVGSSGKELIDVIPILENNNIPFTESKNGNGCLMINFLKSDFKEFLKQFKGERTMSFSGHLTEEIFNLPEPKLKKILEGYFIGDGHIDNQNRKVYSTSSEQLANDFYKISLRLGIPFYLWKQKNHQGLGNKPIWRIYHNSNSHFSKDYGYKNISEVSISSIEKLKKTEMYDLTVEDTHTVILENGIISHQCDDGAILLANLMLQSGIPYWKIRLNAGLVKQYGKNIGHCYVTYYCSKTNKWVLLDWCLKPNVLEITDRKDYKNERVYGRVWFSWNQRHSFTKGLNIEAKELLKKIK